MMATVRFGITAGMVLLLASCGASGGFFSSLTGGENEAVVAEKRQEQEKMLVSLHDTGLTDQQWQQVYSLMGQQQRIEATSDQARYRQLLINEAVRNYLLVQAREEQLPQDPVIARALEQVLVNGWLERNTVPDSTYPDQQQLEQAWQQNRKQFLTEAKVALSQIFIARDEAGEGLGQIEQLKRILNGDPDQFPLLAKQYSSHEESAELGGRMGVTPVKQLQPAILKAIANLKQGEISEVVEMQGGYHIVKIDEIQPATVRPLDEVKPLLVKALRMQRQDEMKKKLLNKLSQAVEFAEIVQ